MLNLKFLFFLILSILLLTTLLSGLVQYYFNPTPIRIMQVELYNPCILTTREQKLSSYDGERCDITFELSQYEFINFGSESPITFLQIIILFFVFFACKENLAPRQYKAQMLLTKFSNLHIIHTVGTNLNVADKLSRDLSQSTNKICQLQHQPPPLHTKFMQLKSKYLLNRIHSLIKCIYVLSFRKQLFTPNAFS